MSESFNFLWIELFYLTDFPSFRPVGYVKTPVQQSASTTNLCISPVRKNMVSQLLLLLRSISFIYDLDLFDFFMENSYWCFYLHYRFSYRTIRPLPTVFSNISIENMHFQSAIIIVDGAEVAIFRIQNGSVSARYKLSVNYNKALQCYIFDVCSWLAVFTFFPHCMISFLSFCELL